VIDWNDLRYLWTIARAGSLAAAARELRVEHTTVGRRLSALEAELGTKLFVRGPSGLVATPPCREALAQLDTIAADIAQLERVLTGGDTRVDGPVRLTAPELMSPYLAHHLQELRRRHPELAVELLGADRHLDLMAGEADLAIRAVRVDDPGLVARKLVDVGFAVFGSEAYLARKGALAAPDDLRGHDIIAFSHERLTYHPGATWLDQRSAGANVVLRANSMHGALNAVLDGIGVTVLPCLPYMDARVRRMSPSILPPGLLHLAVHPDLVRVARVRTVIDFIDELVERDRAQFG
jgi:DNA-binding transcriptional LysR family regulator